MYMIKNSDGRFFAGDYFGLPIWKDHFTRGCIYNTKSAAEKDTSFYGLSDTKIIYIKE